MMVGTSKISWSVREHCTVSPLIEAPIDRLSGSSNSSGVTSQGPMGPKRGNDLARLNCGIPRHLGLPFRQVLSHAQTGDVGPGRSPGHLIGRTADDHDQLDLPVCVAAGRKADVAPRTGDARRNFVNTGGSASGSSNPDSAACSE